jgi:hypothetical protein
MQGEVTEMRSKALLKIVAGATVLMLAVGTAPAAAPAYAQSAPETSSAGTDFRFVFPGLPGWNEVVSRRLFIASEMGASGTVSIPSLAFDQPFTVTEGGISEVDLFAGALVVGSGASATARVDLPLEVDGVTLDGVLDLTIRVTSDNPVTVYAVSENSFASDAFLALPVSAFAREHYVLTYEDTIAQGSMVAVIAAEDETTVTVVPSTDTRLRAAGESYQVTVDAGEVYGFVGIGGDLSGTRIISNKPVGVVTGLACVNVPAGVGFCDNAIAMLPPISTWGREFAVMNLAGRSNSGQVLRVMAARNDTTVILEVVGGESQTVVLDAGEFVASPVLVDSALSVRADRPVMVAQFARGGASSGSVGDPFMTLAPPVQQFLTGYTIATPGNRFENWVSLITTDAGRSQVTIGGTPVASLTDDSWLPIAGDWYGINVRIEPGSYRIETDGAPLGVSSYGFKQDESYGYPGGLGLQSITPEDLSVEVVEEPVPDVRNGSPAESFVRAPDGSTPSSPIGFAAWQQTDGSSVPLVQSSPGPNQVRYSADGFEVTFTGGQGTGVSQGLVADPNGEVVCEICAFLAAGGVIEAWMFSEPRLVAAWRIEDLPCQRFTIPVVAPLDGGGPVPAGVHTLQLALPTVNGMQAVNVGVTVGSSSAVPVPNRVNTGGGPVPVMPLSFVLLLAAMVAALVTVDRGREVAAVVAGSQRARVRAAQALRLPAFDALDLRIAQLREAVRRSS